ncbi:hypothetical protein GBA52_015266 [Prunus armeniaca]|nr:hypothetical protein GBA52_015266 [Prunus armeniaca]
MRKGWLSDGRVDGVAALRRVKKLSGWHSSGLNFFLHVGPVWAQGILSRSIHFGDLSNKASSFGARNQCYWGMPYWS